MSVDKNGAAAINKWLVYISNIKCPDNQSASQYIWTHEEDAGTEAVLCKTQAK